MSSVVLNYTDLERKKEIFILVTSYAGLYIFQAQILVLFL